MITITIIIITIITYYFKLFNYNNKTIQFNSIIKYTIQK